MNPVCLDSSAWIEIAHDGPNSKKFARALSTAGRVLVSTISIYEIARYTTRVAGEAASEQLLAFIRQNEVIPVSDEIAALAASLGPRHKLAMADALVLATAASHQATLWTQDQDFQGLPQVKFLPKIKTK